MHLKLSVPGEIVDRRINLVGGRRGLGSSVPIMVAHEVGPATDSHSFPYLFDTFYWSRYT